MPYFRRGKSRRRRQRVRRAARRAARKTSRKIRRRRAVAGFVRAGKSVGVVEKKRFILVPEPNQILPPTAGVNSNNWRRSANSMIGPIDLTSTLFNGIKHMPSPQADQRFASDHVFTKPKFPPYVPSRYMNKAELSYQLAAFPFPHYNSAKWVASTSSVGGVNGASLGINGNSAYLNNLHVSGTVGYRNVQTDPSHGGTTGQPAERFEVQWLRVAVLRCEWLTDNTSRQTDGITETVINSWLEKIRQNLPDPVQTANRPMSRCPLGNATSLREKHPRYALDFDDSTFKVVPVKEKTFYVKDGTIEDIDRVRFSINVPLKEKYSRPANYIPEGASNIEDQYRWVPLMKHWYCVAMISSVGSVPYLVTHGTDDEPVNVQQGFFIESPRISTSWLDS